MNSPFTLFPQGVPSEFGVPRAKSAIRPGALCQGSLVDLEPEYYENLIKSMPDRIKAENAVHVVVSVQDLDGI